MRDQLKVFGFPMQQQRNRRMLVVLTYAALVSLWFGMWKLAGIYTAGTWVYLAAVLFVNGFIFGGYGFKGLLKPFVNRPPRGESAQTMLLKLELERRTGLSFDASEWKNDERELRRRDHAHYQAYQAMMIPLALLWLIVTLQLNLSHWHWLSQNTLSILLYSIVLPTIVVLMTLPQAILLWTEPDISSE
jgi:hypothetical protein